MDLLAVSFYKNDLYIPGVSMPRRLFIWDKVLGRVLPFYQDTIRLTTKSINGFLYSLPYFANWGFDGWLNNLYSKENLKAYEEVIRELKNYGEARGMPIFVVMLAVAKEDVERQYGQIAEILERYEMTNPFSPN